MERELGFIVLRGSKDKEILFARYYVESERLNSSQGTSLTESCLTLYLHAHGHSFFRAGVRPGLISFSLDNLVLTLLSIILVRVRHHAKLNATTWFRYFVLQHFSSKREDCDWLLDFAHSIGVIFCAGTHRHIYEWDCNL